MKIVLNVLFVFSVVVMMGCSFEYTRNMQRANIRSVGDTSITASLDAVDDPNDALVIRDQTKTITKAVQSFINRGHMSELTIPEITVKLEKLVPTEYSSIVTFLMSKVQGINVNTQVIGVNNIRRLDAACIGIILACEQYSVEDREGYVFERSVEKDPSLKSVEAFNKQITARAAKQRP